MPKTNGTKKIKRKIGTYFEGNIKCICGHSVKVLKDRAVCSWCGRYVYKNKKIEFEERLKMKLC